MIREKSCGAIVFTKETELISIHLMDYETAMAAFQFDSLRRLLTDAHNFLTQP